MNDGQDKDRSTTETNVVLSRQVVAKGKWLSFSKVKYRDLNGVEREYESTERTTRPTGSDIDGVTIIATLKRALHFDCLVLVKQFRPPIGSYTVEFPSGLTDSGESAVDAALRELQEETGYTASEAISVSPVVLPDPGASNTSECLVQVIIDGDDKRNSQPTQNLDEEEFIEVLVIPIHDLLNRLSQLANSGMYIDSKLMSYALAANHQNPKLEPAAK